MMGIMIKEDKHKKILLIIIVLILLALGIFWAKFLQEKNVINVLSDSNFVTWNLGNKTISLEISDTPQEHYLGLSNRDSLCPDCGMLFVFEDLNDQSFVMRNMNFPLDILFIRDGRIVKIYKNLAPEGSAPTTIYSSGEPVNYVLELNAGKTSELGLEEGMVINLPVE